MLKVLTFGLSFFAFAYPFAAQAQYGKVALPVNSAKVQAESAPSANGVAEPAKDNVAAPLKNAPAPSPAVSMKSGEKVEIFFDDFNIKKTLGGQVFCQMTFYVSNQTDKMLDSLMTDITWSGIATKLNFSAVEPTDIKTVRYALAGSGCYTMGESPILKISRCLMRAKDASGKIVDVPEEICKQSVVFK